MTDSETAKTVTDVVTRTIWENGQVINRQQKAVTRELPTEAEVKAMGMIQVVPNQLPWKPNSELEQWLTDNLRQGKSDQILILWSKRGKMGKNTWAKSLIGEECILTDLKARGLANWEDAGPLSTLRRIKLAVYAISLDEYLDRTLPVTTRIPLICVSSGGEAPRVPKRYSDAFKIVVIDSPMWISDAMDVSS